MIIKYYGFNDLTTEELAEKIRSFDTWEPELMNELLKRADMLDELEDCEFVEELYERAAEKLGVEIY